MTQKHALILAAALTAMVLVVLGGLVTRHALPAAAVTDPLGDPTVQALLQAREVEYRQALAQANQQLQEAYQQLGRTQPGQAQQTAAPAVSADRAATVARDLVPGATLTKPPELVVFEGRPAYEIVLDQGTLYVDANSGGVLYNGASSVAGSGPIDEQQASAIATAYLGGGSVRRVERERERGMAVYEVKFVDGSKVYVTEDAGQVAYAEIAGREPREEHAGERDDD